MNACFLLFNIKLKWNVTQKTFQMGWIIASLPQRKKRLRFRSKLRLRFILDGRSNLWDNYHFHFIVINHQPLNHPCSVTSCHHLIIETKIRSENTFRLIRVVVVVVVIAFFCSCFNQVVMFMRRRSNTLHHPSGLLWACSSPDLSFSRGTLWVIASVTF